MTAYWDDYGITAFDKSKATENAEAFAKMLGMQGVEAGGLDHVPVGRLADYFVAPINLGRKLYGTLKGSGGRMQAVAGDVQRAAGVTRILFAGAPGESVIEYAGSGMTIEDVVIQGHELRDARMEAWSLIEPNIAGAIIHIDTNLKGQVDTGKLTTRGVSMIAAKRGIVCGQEGAPAALHADNCVHYSLWCDRIKIAFESWTRQAVDHVFFDTKIWQHAEGFARINYGGHLRAYGVSVNYCPKFELLYVGELNENGGNAEIHGLSTDASCRSFRLLNHGKYAARVRIDGMIAGGSTLADPVVLDREPSDMRFKDIGIDVNHGYRKL